MRDKLDLLVKSYGGYTRFAADMGKSEISIYRICKGKSNPTLTGAFKISELLSCPVDELFNDLKTVC